MKTQLMQLRKAAGYKSRDEFAKALGVKPLTYKTWETGTRNFTLEQACTIADVLGCTLDELAGREWPRPDYQDQRQADLNELFDYLDDANRTAAVGAVRGIAASQAEKKTAGEGPAASDKRTA